MDLSSSTGAFTYVSTGMMLAGLHTCHDPSALGLQIDCHGQLISHRQAGTEHVPFIQDYSQPVYLHSHAALTTLSEHGESPDQPSQVNVHHG